MALKWNPPYQKFIRCAEPQIKYALCGVTVGDSSGGVFAAPPPPQNLMKKNSKMFALVFCGAEGGQEGICNNKRAVL